MHPPPPTIGFTSGTVSETALAGTSRVDIATLKQQARTLEQEGSVGEALAVYQQILSELDAIGGIRQELPLLIKIGDLQVKAGDVDGAVDMYERAAGEYATQGAAQPVMSLCVKIVRADPQAVGAYLRLARRLLEAGYTDGARSVLMDYAQRAKLDKTRQGLEILAGRAEDEVKRVLSKAIDVAAERVPKRPARPPRPAPPPREEPREPPPPPEPPTPKKRITVPVGALDAEPEPNLLQQRPPEPRPEVVAEPPSPKPDLQAPKKRFTVPVGALDAESEPNLLRQRPPEPRPEVTPESLFPKPEDLQAPVLPHVPATPPPAVSPPVAPPLPAPGFVEPLQIEAVAPSPPAPPPPPLPPPAPPPAPPMRVSSELVLEPSFAPTPAAEPRPEEPVTGRPSRVSRSQPRLSRVSVATPRPSPRGPRRLWPMVGVVVIVGGVGALLWLRVIPPDRVPSWLPQRQPEPVEVQPEPWRPVEPAPDTLMARDTATAEPVAAAEPAPSAAAPQPALPPLPPPTLPPGVVLSGTVYVVLGLAIESVEEILRETRPGFRIAQVLGSGQRIMLEEFPADTTIEGEIGVTGLPGDTVVGHVRIGGVDVTLKGVISETLAVELLQRLVQVRP